MPQTQKNVTNAITNFLPEIGFRTTKLRNSTKNGTFLRAVHQNYARYFLIETCGDFTNSRNNNNWNRENFFYAAVGRMITQYQNNKNYNYGIAFPDNFKSFFFKKFDAATLKHFNLNFFFVSPKGRVEFWNTKNFNSKNYYRKAA